MDKKTFTRRDFVRLGTGAVVAGAALKTTLLQPSSLWAQVTSSDKVRFASIGTGVRGCEVLKGALQAGGPRAPRYDIIAG